MSSRGQTGNEQRGNTPASMPAEQKQTSPQVPPQSYNSAAVPSHNQGWPGYQNSPVTSQWPQYSSPSPPGYYGPPYSAMPSTPGNYQQPNPVNSNTQSNGMWNGRAPQDNYQQWNSSYQSSQRYPGGWLNTQNASMSNMPPGNNANYYRGQQSGYQGGYNMFNQTPVANWWNYQNPDYNSYNWNNSNGAPFNRGPSATNVDSNNRRNRNDFMNSNAPLNNTPNNWQDGNNDMTNANWNNSRRNENARQSNSVSAQPSSTSTVTRIASAALSVNGNQNQ